MDNGASLGQRYQPHMDNDAFYFIKALRTAGMAMKGSLAKVQKNIKCGKVIGDGR